MTTANAGITLKGKVQKWNLTDNPTGGQEYIVANVNYGVLRQIAKPYLFSAQDGTGEQRDQKKARLRYLKQQMVKDNYTPVAWYLGLRPDNEIEIKDDTAKIHITEDHMLPLTDAGHRRGVLEELRREGGTTARRIDNLPIPCIIHLNPNKTKTNFINLQDKFSVDPGQLLTMKITNQAVKKNQQDFYNFSLEIAKLLHAASNSHLYRLVKFDTQSGGSLPFKTIAQSSKSDLSTSLFGTAMIAKDYGKDEEWAANMILFAYENLQIDAPELMKKGCILAPEPDGTAGGSTMIIGLGNMFAYRMKLLEREIPLKADNDWFIECVHSVFDDEMVDGNFSSQRKRQLMGDFARELFSDLIEAEDSVIGAHDGLPISLLNLLGTSTFGAMKLEKPKGKRGRPKKNAEPVPVEPEAPVVHEEVPVEEVREDTDTDPAWVDEPEAQTEEKPPWEE